MGPIHTRIGGAGVLTANNITQETALIGGFLVVHTPSLA